MAPERDELTATTAPAVAASTSSFAPGRAVDHFVIEGLIGEGGMGTVYAARDQKLGRRVALKVVRSDALSREALERFLHEARTTARFSHPHIVTVYAVGEVEGMPYVALEHLEGPNLGQRLRSDPPKLPESLRILHAVAQALAEAHRHGVLHRDLKPANVVIARGRVRVVDFGLAKVIERPDSPRSLRLSLGESAPTMAGAGTPGYMAPEQWRADATTEATDVWALGALVFELCARRKPFSADTVEELAQAVCSDEAAPRLRELAEVPAELDAIVARCLAKAPAERPHADEVAGVLARLVEPGLAPGSSGRRVWWLAALTLAIGLAVGFALPGARVRTGDEERVAVAQLPEAPAPIATPASSAVAPIARAATATASAPVAPPSASALARRPRARPFDTAAAEAVLATGTRNAQRCTAFHLAPGAYTVHIVMANDGGVWVGGQAPLGGNTATMTAWACVRSSFTGMSVPPYDGPERSFDRTVAVR